MAHFIAYQAVNMNDLPGWSTFESGGPVTTPIENGAELQIMFTDGFVFDLKNLAGHSFTYGPPPDINPTLTGGTISSLQVDLNDSIVYKFTGLQLLVHSGFAADILAGHFHAALELLLAGNDTIRGSPGNDILVGGPRHNTFVYTTKHFGQDTITNFTVNDRIEFSHTIFHNLAQVQHHSHVDAHGHVVIVADASDTITLDTIHHVSGLTVSEFLFI